MHDKKGEAEVSSLVQIIPSSPTLSIEVTALTPPITRSKGYFQITIYSYYMLYHKKFCLIFFVNYINLYFQNYIFIYFLISSKLITWQHYLLIFPLN